jgi:thiol:disulfide interchange protein
MAASAVACLWLLWRQSGSAGLALGVLSIGLLAALLFWAGQSQRRGRSVGAAALAGTVAIACAAALLVPAPRVGAAAASGGAAKWSEAAVARERAAGHPVFVYFTADWCLTCKVNEAAAIERDEVQAAFRKAGVKTLVGDWTNGEPAITRFIDARARAGVPLYLWYEPGGGEAEELPQILTPAMLSDRARRPRR